MAENDAITIVIDDDVPAGAEPNDAVSDLKSQYATIQRQLEDEKRARAEAEARAGQVARARDADIVAGGIATAQADVAAAKLDLEIAAERGDWRAQANAQERIAEATSRKQRLDEARADIETRNRQPSGDPVEQFIQTRDPGTQAWLRAHPEEVRALILDPNSRKAAKLRAADEDAVSEGYTRGSTEYFRHIEQFARIGKETGSGTRRSSPPAAPVSGASGAGGGARSGAGTQVSLSSGEVAAAEDGTHTWNPGNRHPKTGLPIKHNDPLVGQPIGRIEFARRKMELTKSGAYQNFLVEQ